MAKKCIYCGMTLKGKPEVCPLCGTSLQAKADELHIHSTAVIPKKRRKLLPVFIGIPVIAVLVLCAFLWNRSPAPEEVSRTPEERWSDHLYLESRNTGVCKKLTGKVELTFVFVNEPNNAWTAEPMDDARRVLEREVQVLTREAASYGASLEIHLVWETWNVPYTANHAYPYYWQLLYAEEQGFPSLVGFQKTRARQSGASSAPLVFLFCKEGRSYSVSNYADKTWETSVLFDPEDFRHELCHLYGAEDLYFHPEVEKMARKHLSGSIMNDGKAVDDLTAYCIGWTDTLSQAAVTFLEETMVLNHTDLETAREKDKGTGYFTGEDTLVYQTGDSYTGEFVDGIPHGQGTYTFADGSVYKGGIEEGYFHGYGEYTDAATGYRYEGDFCYGRIEGKGTLTFANGDVYEGDFLRGWLHGQGKMTYANGDVYVGAFEYNMRHGEGTYTYADGSVDSGTWQNDAFFSGTTTKPDKDPPKK